jgi:hypothetical protein
MVRASVQVVTLFLLLLAVGAFAVQNILNAGHLGSRSSHSNALFHVPNLEHVRLVPQCIIY